MNTLKTAQLLRTAGRRIGSSGRRGLTNQAAFQQGSSSSFSSKSILAAAGLAVAATAVVEMQRQEVCSDTRGCSLEKRFRPCPIMNVSVSIIIIFRVFLMRVCLYYL